MNIEVTGTHEEIQKLKVMLRIAADLLEPRIEDDPVLRQTLLNVVAELREASQ